MISRAPVAPRIAAPPSRVFEAFTAEIDQWWQPNPLFPFTERRDGRLAIEPRRGGRVTETTPTARRSRSGGSWPGSRRRGWYSAGGRPRSRPGHVAAVHVRYEDVDCGTRVVVEHVGWDRLPQEHAARHGFPLFAFQQRLAEWWRSLRSLLESLGQRAG